MYIFKILDLLGRPEHDPNSAIPDPKGPDPYVYIQQKTRVLSWAGTWPAQARYDSVRHC